MKGLGWLHHSCKLFANIISRRQQKLSLEDNVVKEPFEKMHILTKQEMDPSSAM